MAVSGFDLFGSGGSIKRIQRGVVSPSGITTDVPIDPVDLENAVPLVICHASDSPNARPNNTFATIEFIDNQTLRFQLNTYSVNSGIFVWRVIEFEKIKSMQNGIALVSSAPTEVRIDEIDVSKAILFASFRTDDSNNAVYRATYSYRIKNSTTLEFIYNDSVADGNVIHWYLVEV